MGKTLKECSIEERKMTIKFKKLSMLLIMCCLAVGAEARDTRPNIVLLISDQHTGKVMTQTGYPFIQTSGIDRLAAEGVTFTRSYCTNPVSDSFPLDKIPAPPSGMKMTELSRQ